ncbi:MAG: helix-turn-helix transcriptional regulator [Candidatus Omnitrophica bacterium]|nr:helix-turn-helix transcriptional regulator [Candidatus Omnitrophota bacterium]
MGQFINISKAIIKYRKIMGLSRNDFAKLAGVGKTALYDVEHGKSSIKFDTLEKILTALNIAIEIKTPDGRK